MKTLSFLVLSLSLLSACGSTKEPTKNSGLLDSITAQPDPAAVEEAMKIDEVVTDYGFSPTEPPILPEAQPELDTVVAE